MYSKGHNIEIMEGEETDEIIKELHKSLSQKNQQGLEKSMRGSKFIWDSVDFLYYHLQKMGFKRVGSYINSSEWLKNKKATKIRKITTIIAFSML